MSTETLTYGDFSAGDWGRIGPEKAPKNSFKGTNVIPYRTGEIGVRAGVRLTNPTGQSNGVIWGLGVRPLNPGDIWYGQGTAIKYFTPGAGAAVSTAGSALTGTPSRVAIDETGTTTYIATTTVNGYSFNGTTITQLTNMPHAQAIAVYGDRLAVVPVSATNTVQFSAAASFNNWTISAGNAVSVTVGDTDPITALFSQKNRLAILKKFSSFYNLTGTPGTSEALRPAIRFDGPTAQYAAGRTRSDDRIWFAPLNAQQLGAFDGSNVDWFDNLPLSLYSGLAGRSIVPLKDDDQGGLAVVVNEYAPLSAPNEVWLRYRGVWTRHTFGVGITNFAVASFGGYPQDGDSDASDLRYGTKLVFSDGGGASATPNFWSWQPFTDRPGLEADPFTNSTERAGDASTTAVTGSFELPHFADPNGREVVVRRVRVEFRSWNNGAADDTQFGVTVRAIREYDGVYVDSGTQTWQAAPALSSLAGTYRRKEFSFGDQGFGSGFQIRVSGMKGVAIRRIVVSYDSRPPR